MRGDVALDNFDATFEAFRDPLGRPAGNGKREKRGVLIAKVYIGRVSPAVATVH